MPTPTEILEAIDQAILDITTTGAVQESTKGLLRWKKYDMQSLLEGRKYYRRLQQEAANANAGGLAMAKAINKEPT